MKISLPTWTWALTLTSERIQQYLQVPKSSNGIGTSLIIHPCTTFLVYRSEERSHENKKQCISIDSSHIPSLSFLHMYVHPFSVSPTDLYSTHAISYQLFHAALLRTMPSPSLTLHFAFYAFHDQTNLYPVSPCPWSCSSDITFHVTTILFNLVLLHH